MVEWIQSIDTSILIFIQENLSFPLLDKIMIFITTLAEYGAIWIIVALLFLFSKKYRKYGVIMAIALLIMYVCNDLILKHIIGRLRPFEVNPEWQILISQPSGSSFPSGHTAVSFTGALCVSMANKKFAPYAYILAVLIAFSRIYLLVHYPSDIIGGAVVGTLYALLAIWVYKLIDKKFIKGLLG